MNLFIKKPLYYINKYSKSEYKENEIYFAEYENINDEKTKYIIFGGKSNKYSYKDWACYQCCYDIVLFLDKDMKIFKIGNDVVSDLMLFIQGKRIEFVKPIKIKIEFDEN